MENEELKPGDVVNLISGGPPMTIAGINQGIALCYWFVALQVTHELCRH